MADDSGLSRRQLLAGGLAAVAIAGCSSSAPSARSGAEGSTSSTAASVTSTSTVAAASGPPVTGTGGPATFVSTGPASAQAVALTFHTNGDPALCNALFDDAKRLQAPVTFFIVGQWLHDNAAVAQRLVAD